MNKLFLIIILVIFNQAHAYLDPGTGSMLLSALVAVIATLYFAVKAVYYKGLSLIARIFNIKLEKNSSPIVFYAESAVYWNSFKPVLEALEQQGVEATYLTSSEDDPGLNCDFKYIKPRYIGAGNQAFSYLNMLEAKVCVLTTPGLDVLQIRRSKGVKHYAHIVHAMTDIGLYKLYSFDYYDSIFCSGAHQMTTLRLLEASRGTPEKILFKAGCPYTDVLKKQLAASQARTSTDKQCILIAPTWGNNGLLKRFGAELLQGLLNHSYKIIVRPHPQSLISEKDLIETLQNQFSSEDIQWDFAKDNFQALFQSDIMISDLSGVIFDYAFIFEKPVITIDVEVNLLGTEIKYIDHPVWEVAMLDQVGKKIKIEELAILPDIIKNLLQDETMKDHLAGLRAKHLFNYGSAGKIIAQELINLISQDEPPSAKQTLSDQTTNVSE